MSWPAACPTLCFAASLRFIAQNFKPTIAQALQFFNCQLSLNIAVSTIVSIFIEFQVTIPLVYLIYTMVRIGMLILDFGSNSNAFLWKK